MYKEIPLIDYIDLEEEQVDIYLHTKDHRLIALKDVRSNVVFDDIYLTFDYIWYQENTTFVMLRDDFSCLDYRIVKRSVPPKNNDAFHTYPHVHDSETLREP